MRVEVTRDARRQDSDREVEAFAARHKSFESLRQRVFVERCNDPAAEDDYVVWKTLTAGGELEDRTVFDTPEVFRTLTPRRVELLEYLHANPVNSVRELAEKIHRDYKNTYEDLVALQGWGLIALNRHGKSQRPSSLVSRLQVVWDK